MLQEFNLSLKKENETHFIGRQRAKEEIKRAAQICSKLENPISVFYGHPWVYKHNALCGIRTEHAHFTFY